MTTRYGFPLHRLVHAWKHVWSGSAEWLLRTKHRLSAFYHFEHDFRNVFVLHIAFCIVVFHLGAVSTQRSPRRRVSDTTSFDVAANEMAN